MSFVLTYDSLVSTALTYAERGDDTTLVATMPVFIINAQRRIARECKILGLQAYATSTFTAADGVIQKPNRWLKTLSINFGTGSGQVQSVAVTAGGTNYVQPVTVTASGGGGTGATFSAFTTNGVVTQISVTNPGSGYTTAPTLAIAGFGSAGTSAAATATIILQDNKANMLYERSYEFCTMYWPNRALTGTPRFYADYGYVNWLIVPTPLATYPFEIAYYQLAQPIDDATQTNWLTENAPDLLLYATLLEMNSYLKNQELGQLWLGYYQNAKAMLIEEDKGRIMDRQAVRTA